MSRAVRAAATVAAGAVCAACAASPYEARATYAPDQASRVLAAHPSRAWIVRGDERSELPPGARIEPKDAGYRITFPQDALGAHVRRLEDGDAMIVDEEGRLVAIRSKSGAEVHFAPGSASVKPGTDLVLVQQTSEMSIAQTDKVEILTQYAAGDRVPGGGTIEERRKIAPLVGGGLLLVATYGPSAYVGFSSPLKIDRVLLLPALGPWIDLLARPKCNAPAAESGLPVDSCSGETLVKVGLVASGIGQAVGIVLFAIGLPAEAVVVKDESASLRVGPLGARGEF